MSTKVLLDTDIGSDIDDAVCLAYLLAQPQCDLLGITTVSGEPVERAKIASALCKVAGKNIPIYPGVEPPLLIPQRQVRASQASALNKWDHDSEFPKGQAIEFLRETIRGNPGEVTLLAIGPMTNIGLLFAIDPEIPSLLKSLVLMCGNFTNSLKSPRSEWNALIDPHASAIVYNARPAHHRSIGLDVTLQVVMNSDDVRQQFQAPLLRPVVDFAEVWFRETHPSITFHDPLAAATIFEPSVCGYQQGLAEIELTSERLAGLTYWKPDANGPHEIATTVDVPHFYDHFFSVFKR